jgi:hypothetical protein
MHPDVLDIVVTIIFEKSFDAAVDMVMQRTPNVGSVSERIDTGKIPLQHEILIVQGGGILADRQTAEQPVELIRLGDIVIVEQGGKQ